MHFQKEQQQLSYFYIKNFLSIYIHEKKTIEVVIFFLPNGVLAAEMI